MNYTKGEWKIRGHGITSQIYVETPLRLKAKEYQIAEGIYLKTNAHLIAAAPIMYKALKQARDNKGDWRGMIDVALAKAKGK